MWWRSLPAGQQRNSVGGGSLAEQNDEWLIGKRYMRLELLRQAQQVGSKAKEVEEKSEVAEQQMWLNQLSLRWEIVVHYLISRAVKGAGKWHS